MARTAEEEQRDGWIAPARVAVGKQALTPNVPVHNHVYMYWVLGTSPVAALIAAMLAHTVFVGFFGGGLWIMFGWGVLTDSVNDTTIADFVKNSLRWLREPKRYYLKIEKGAVTYGED